MAFERFFNLTFPLSLLHFFRGWSIHDRYILTLLALNVSLAGLRMSTLSQHESIKEVNSCRASERKDAISLPQHIVVVVAVAAAGGGLTR